MKPYCRKRTDEYVDDTDEEQEDEEKDNDEIDDALQLFMKKGSEQEEIWTEI